MTSHAKPRRASDLRAGPSASFAPEKKTSDDGAAAFETFKGRLRDLIGDDATRTWGAVALGPVDGREVTVIAQARPELEERVGAPRLRELWSASDPQKRRIILAAAEDVPANAVQTREAGKPAPRRSLEPSRYAFETFMVGDANRYAFAAAQSIATVDDGSVRLAFIHGGYGHGKTHLLRAVERHVVASEGLTALYLGADAFRASYVDGARAGDTKAFKDRLEASDVLLVDDIHLLAGAVKTQDALYNAVSSALARNGRVLLAADRPASALSELDERLRERLVDAVTCKLDKPDLQLRRRILERMVADSEAAKDLGGVSGEVLDFIASAITTTPRALEGALSTVLLKAKANGQPLTRESAMAALADVLRGATRKVTVEDIQKAVSAYHGLKCNDLLSKSRSRDIVRPRQQAMFLARELTGRSFPDLARRFGGLDHTTVLHGCRRIAHLVSQDPGVREEVEELRRQLRQNGRPAA